MFSSSTLTSPEDLIAWLQEPVDDPLPASVAHDCYLLMHPRIAYLKNVRRNGVILDMGAGDGGLRSFREWLGFERRDLKFVGVSLSHGKHTDSYEEFHVNDFETDPPRFSLQPTDVVAAQFLEHIERPRAFLEWVAGLLPKGGSAFIDWPSSHTVNLPKRDIIRSAGFDITTLNFFDDATHRQAYTISEIIDLAVSSGFAPRACGQLDLPYIAESLKFHGIRLRDQYLLSMAVWLRTRFVSYVCLEKV